ncbi:MAG: enolase C-terminal domain-like protein [Pseudomonadota bacterium]
MPSLPSIEVSGIHIRRLVVPFRRPLNTRVGQFSEGPFLAIDLDLKGGGNARLLGFTFNRLGLTVVPPLLEALAAFAKGRSISTETIGDFHDACERHLHLLGNEGVCQMARSMFDMLLYDGLARAAGVPLYQLLGGTNAPIPAYNSCGLGLLNADAAAREAVELRDANGGFKHIKMRLGRDAVGDDVAAIESVRAAIGPDIKLSADFNQGLSSRVALDVCRAIDHLGLTWIEEPVVYDDYPTQARLARKLVTPIQIGENWWSWRVGKMAIEMGAADLVMPDILRIGGVTGWKRLAAVAEQNAVPFSSHISPDYSAHLMGVTPTADWLEFMDWGQDVLRDPVLPEAGFVRPSERDGAGLEWDEAALQKCVVDA